MGQKQISEVPNPGNDITHIAQTAPGAVMNTDNVYGGNFSILGMPTTSYLLTVDGMHINDNFSNTPLVGALGLLLGQNQIEEATVISTGYSGQFGGAAGGTVNYLTKAGGNQLHGNAQYYWNGRVFNANNWINHAFGNQRPFDIANQWAGSLGGPIKKDKLFFFLDTEGLRLLLPQYQLVAIPSLQFEAATIANIDGKFGPSSANLQPLQRRSWSEFCSARKLLLRPPRLHGVFRSQNRIGDFCSLHPVLHHIPGPPQSRYSHFWAGGLVCD
jgi:hypothetical protein